MDSDEQQRDTAGVRCPSQWHNPPLLPPEHNIHFSVSARIPESKGISIKSLRLSFSFPIEIVELTS